MTEHLIDSAAWDAVSPELSVLTPFHGDDPSSLLLALDAQAAELGGRVEIVLLNDGDPDRARVNAVADLVTGLRSPARLVYLVGNEGRAKGRNRLARHARGRHLLFLDSDMSPDGLDFLARWLEAAAEDAPVAFGGFTVDDAPPSRATALHRALSRHSDCLPAAERVRDPAKHVFTSNLLVRRDVFEAERFDEDFRGWGWEDVEWAMRVGRRWPIAHIDNTATHLGLDTAETLSRKYEQSAANFARVFSAHPEIVSRYPSFRAARVLRLAPLRKVWRPLVRRLMTSAVAPLSLRALAARTYRAALYSEVL